MLKDEEKLTVENEDADEEGHAWLLVGGMSFVMIAMILVTLVLLTHIRKQKQERRDEIIAAYSEKGIGGSDIEASDSKKIQHVPTGSLS